MRLKRSTAILIGLFVLGLVAIAVDAIWKDRKDGTIVVLAPPEAATRVRIDGGEAIEISAGEVKRIPAAHGVHDVDIETPAALHRHAEVKSGRQLRGVPTLASQCFAELDVTLSHYGETAGKRPPEVVKITQETDVFALPSVFPLAESELPDHLTDRVGADGELAHVQLMQLYRTVPCATKDDPQAALRFLGYVR
ncbi:MAG TPA: hypothetical protein VFG69_10420 [Nannocystaceae bacterium]|nr:hypothetical protein [Nannocystaceae bacterium]